MMQSAEPAMDYWIRALFSILVGLGFPPPYEPR